MKRLTWILTGITAVTLVATGCSKQEQPEAPQLPTAREATEMPAPPPMAAPRTTPATEEKAAEWARETTEAATGEFAGVLGAFKNANPETRSAIEKAITAMKAGNYGEALPILQRQFAEGNLTPEQQEMLKPLIAQAQQHVAKKAAEQVVAEPQKALEDLKKSLPFGK